MNALVVRQTTAAVGDWLRDQGADVTGLPAGPRLSVNGATRSQIAQLALDHHIRLDELTDQRASLEDLLVDLTHDAAEFTTA